MSSCAVGETNAQSLYGSGAGATNFRVSRLPELAPVRRLWLGGTASGSAQTIQYTVLN